MKSKRVVKKMPMKCYRGRAAVLRIAKRLRGSTDPGWARDGQAIQIRYRAVGCPTDRAVCEAECARRSGLDLRVFTGTVEKVFKTRCGETVLTAAVLERTTRGDDHHYTYRSFNLTNGGVEWLKVF